MKALDTLYESNEELLSGGLPTEERAASVAIDSRTAELTKTAKLLPELRVGLADFTHHVSPLCVCVFQKVEMFGRCQDILRRCEEMARQTGSATRQSIVSLFSSLTKTWGLAKQSQQLSMVCLSLVLIHTTVHTYAHTLVSPSFTPLPLHSSVSSQRNSSQSSCRLSEHPW